MSVQGKKTRRKKFNLFLTNEEHRTLKAKSALKGITMQQYLINLIYNDNKKDRNINNFMKAWENASEEELEDGDLEAIERGKIEIKAGEVQDFEEAVREIENEG